jgi:hypothetical protein
MVTSGCQAPQSGCSSAIPGPVLVTLLAAAPALAQERLLDASAPDSARDTALTVIKHLANGELEQAAAWSNAPERRFEVLRDYRDSVGEEEFKRIFGRFLAPENRLIAEVAIGPRRLLVWELGEANGQLAGQFYIEVDGKFLLDDVPSRERDQLRRVLRRYRAEQKRGQDPFPEKGS